jgi:uncharacterized membrane protein
LPPLKDGRDRYDYGLVMAIFMGCVYVYRISFQIIMLILVIFLAMIGPEARRTAEHVDEVELSENGDGFSDKMSVP